MRHLSTIDDKLSLVGNNSELHSLCFNSLIQTITWLPLGWVIHWTPLPTCSSTSGGDVSHHIIQSFNQTANITNAASELGFETFLYIPQSYAGKSHDMTKNGAQHNSKQLTLGENWGKHIIKHLSNKQRTDHNKTRKLCFPSNSQ